MAVRIRLARHGRLHRPFFRIVAIDGRCHREGKANEVLGTYDPLLKDKTITIDMDGVARWVKQGAQISLPLVRLLKHEGFQVPAAAAKVANPGSKVKAKPTPKLTGEKGKYGTASRRAVRAHQAKLKAARKAAAATAAPAAEAPKA